MLCGHLTRTFAREIERRMNHERGEQDSDGHWMKSVIHQYQASNLQSYTNAVKYKQR